MKISNCTLDIRSFETKNDSDRVVLCENRLVEVRLINEEIIPDNYKPKSQLSRILFENLKTILRETTDYSLYPTNLYFTEIKPIDLTRTLAERADKLFSEQVIQYIKEY